MCDNIKKILITVLIYVGVTIISIPCLFFALAMMVMTTDGGTNMLSLFNIMDICTVMVISIMLCGISVMPHIISRKILKQTKLEEKNMLSIKMYEVFMWIECLLIFIYICLIQFDFSMFY